MRRSPLVLLFVVLAMLAAACGSDDGGESVAVGSDNAPVADTADGGQIDFGSLEGSDTMLWFWAPW